MFALTDQGEFFSSIVPELRRRLAESGSASVRGFVGTLRVVTEIGATTFRCNGADGKLDLVVPSADGRGSGEAGGLGGSLRLPQSDLTRLMWGEH